MGRIPISPPPPGEACTICWGSGKPLGPGPTPSVVTAIFSDIEVIVPGGPNTFLDLTVKLSQLVGLPCVWQGDAGDFSASFQFLVNDSRVLLSFDSDRFFTSLPVSPCVLDFVGSETASLPAARGGACRIIL